MRYCLVEYGAHAADRKPVEEFGTIELTPDDVAAMNRRMVRTPCRMLPANWFGMKEDDCIESEYRK